MAPTPDPPYVAVIFTNMRTPGDDAGYDAAAGRMTTLASEIDGFLGIESVRGSSGEGITVSYWADAEAVETWRTHPDHLDTQGRGRRDWYAWYELRVGTIERATSYEAPSV